MHYSFPLWGAQMRSYVNFKITQLYSPIQINSERSYNSLEFVIRSVYLYHFHNRIALMVEIQILDDYQNHIYCFLINGQSVQKT